MAGPPTQLPLYLSLKYEEGGAYAAMESDVVKSISRIGSEFNTLTSTANRAMADIAKDMAQAGGSDIGVGRFREMAQAQQASAAASKQLAAAAARVAEAEGSGSLVAMQAAQRFADLAAKEQIAATEAVELARVMQLVQAEIGDTGTTIDKTVGAHRRLAAANDNVTRSAGAQRAASVGLGQQLQDSVIQLQMGTSAATVFAQQGSQLAYQLANVGGKVGAVASVFAGPWGAAIFGATALLSPLLSGLFKTSDAMDEVKFASDGVTSAQGILGTVLDLTTGKLTTQRGALLGLAQAQILVNQVQAQQRAAAARKDVLAIQDRPLRFTGGGLGGGFTAGRRREDARDAISASVLAGELDSKTAVQRLGNLRRVGQITDDEFTKAAAAVANLGLELENIKTYDKADALLNGKGGRDLLKPEKAKKPKFEHSAEKAAREAERLAKFGDGAAESIARLNERFDQSPKLIDQVAQATRQLDDVIADLSKRKPIGFAAMIEEAKATKAVVADALQRPIEEMRQESERRLALQGLLARGLDDEAAAAQAVWSIEEKLGSEEALRAKVQDLITKGRTAEAAAFEKILDQYPAMKQQTAELAKADAARSRELEAQRALFEAQLDVINTARTSLTSLLSGRGGNPLKEIGQSLKDLQGKRSFNALFAGAFDDLERQMRSRSPLGKATDQLVTGVDTARTAVTTHAEVVDESMRKIRAAIDGFDAGAGSSTDANPTYGDIVVEGRRPAKTGPLDVSKPSIAELSDRIAHGIVDPLASRFDSALGTTFFQNLSGTLSGAISGYMQAGKVGSVIGAARGLAFDYGPNLFDKGTTEDLLAKFDGALAGARTGSMVAGVSNMLGLKMSGTGAQLGGAAGSFLPFPGGDIVGSIAGGLLGNLFKHNSTARALVTDGDTYSLGGSDKGQYSAASGLGNSVTGGLQKIADAFDAEIGTFLVSIGTRGDEIRVNTGNSSLKKDKGAVGFGDDAEAATRYAILDAINDGALKGMRESTLRLLKAGKDLDKALQDATDFEGALKELRSIKDPLGAALDGLDAEFGRLVDLATTAGASAGEWADLEELYGIKRQAAVDEAEQKLVGSLKGLLDGLTVGNDALSLRDRDAAARAVYDPLKARVAAGDTTAYDDFADAAQQLLAIEREMYGSQQGYFDRLDEVTKLTRDRIGAETNIVSIAENRDSPFDSAGKVKDSIVDQTAVLGSHLDALNTNVGNLPDRIAEAILAKTGSGGVRNFYENTFY
jgi:hypothetical protein